MPGVLDFVLYRELARSQGVQEEREQNRIAVIGSVAGVTPIGVVATRELARQSVEATPPANVAVPDPGGRIPRADYLKQLDAAGLTNPDDRVFEVKGESGEASGLVVAVDPVPGTQVPVGSVVTLAVTGSTVVPDVTSLQTVQIYTQLLKNAKLTPGRVIDGLQEFKSDNPDVQGRIVVNSVPKSKSPVPEETVVDLLIKPQAT